MQLAYNTGEGHIVSNSWLDVDYGKGLQEFFLNNYRIIAIIESKVERWFEQADVNTCIVILEKCKDKKKRDENLVRFVYLFNRLDYFIPQAQEMWQEQIDRLNEIDKLKKTIMAHSEFYQNEDLRILPKSQKELWEEGLDNESGKYVGAKWGKYLRAPEVFFKILEKGKGKLVPLKEIADVRRGFTTGANEFFYLTEEEIKRRGIEKEFWMHQDDKGNWVPNYVIKSPRECKSIVVNPEDLKYRVLMIHKDKKNLRGTNVLKYIGEGEGKGYHLRPTCASRERWYDLGERETGQGLWVYVINDRYISFLNKSKVYSDCELFDIYVHGEGMVIPLLTSSVSVLFSEIESRLGLGQGALKKQVYELCLLPIAKPSLFSKGQAKKLKEALNELSTRPVGSVFSEFGASSPEEVSLDKVKPDRRELDKIVMGEILGLTDEEQLEVYRAVVDLVKSRIEKAKSFGKRRKTKEGIDIDLLVKTVMDKLGGDTLGRFYREKVLTCKPLRTKSLPKVPGDVKLEQELFGWRLSSGREHIDCTSETEGRYLKVWLEAGLDSVKIPKDEDYLEEIVPKLESLKQKTDEVFEDYLGSILDSKLRQRLLHQLWQEVTR